MKYLKSYKIFEEFDYPDLLVKMSDKLQDIFDEYDINYVDTHVVKIGKSNTIEQDGDTSSMYWQYDWSGYDNPIKTSISIHVLSMLESLRIHTSIESIKSSIEDYIGKEIFVYRWEDDGWFITIGLHRIGS